MQLEARDGSGATALTYAARTDQATSSTSCCKVAECNTRDNLVALR